MKNLLAANVMIAPLYLITNSLLVVGNCYAAKPSVGPPNNGDGGLRPGE